MLDGATKQHVKKMDRVLMEARVGVGKVSVLPPEEMAAEITARDSPSFGQTGETASEMALLGRRRKLELH